MLAKILDQRHADYDHAALETYEALYEGGHEFRERLATFLPKAPMEGAERYRERMQFATYTNHTAPLVDMIGAWLFAKPPTVDGLPDDRRAWLDDVDGRGTDWSAWWREPFTRANCDGRAYVLANLPKRPADAVFASKADEEAAGLSTPFLVSLEAENVINWQDDDRGNLAAVMIRTCETVQASLLEPARKVIRWTLIDAVQIQRWEFECKPEKPHPEPTDDIPIAAGYPVVHNMGRFPVVRATFPPGMHALRKLADPATALLRTEHDHDWALRVGAHPLLVVTTTEGASGKPIVASGAYSALTRDASGEDKMAYCEPSGGSYAARLEWIDHQLDALHRVVQQMATAMSSDSSSAGAKSAAAKMADWKSMEVMLTAYADIMRTAMEQVLDIVAGAAMFALDRATLSVGGMAGWAEADIVDVVATFAAAFPEIKSPTFRKMAAKGMARRLLPDIDAETMAKIEAELDDADYDDVPILAPMVDEDGAETGANADEEADAGKGGAKGAAKK